MDKKLLHRYSTHRTEARSLTHESSSVGARSSSAAPVGQDHGPNTRALFVGALPYIWSRWFCSTGAAEDGHAPTEERSCIRDADFCSTTHLSRIR